jgi:tetratricopeptide (TPR) repeat protein
MTNRHALALADEDHAIRLEPTHPLAYVNRAETLNKLGDHVAAVNSIDTALQLAPGFPPALDVQKKIGPAAKSAEPSPQAAQDNFRRCGMPVTDVGPPPEEIKRVIAACTVLINSSGGSADNRALVHLQRGSMYRRLGKFELALVDFSESVRYDPKSADAYTGRGNAYRGLKLFEQAVADHTEAIRLRPDFATSYNNRANAWSDLKDTAHALADYDIAIKLNPNYASAYYNRGNLRLDTGDKDGAIADYQQAVKLNPNFKAAAEALNEVKPKL